MPYKLINLSSQIPSLQELVDEVMHLRLRERKKKLEESQSKTGPLPVGIGLPNSYPLLQNLSSQHLEPPRGLKEELNDSFSDMHNATTPKNLQLFRNGQSISKKDDVIVEI